MAPQVLPAAADVACASCGAAFASRNALFKHLRAAHSLPPKPPAHAAERAALVISYVGDAYRGLQRTDVADALPTVEGALWRAVGHACTDDAGDESWEAQRKARVHPHACARAARTDAGVHAVANVLSVTLPALAAGAEDGWVGRVNEALPADVRVLRRVRVAPAFDAQRTCERRTYEYLLPAAALLPDAAAVGEAEVVALRKRLRSLLKRFRGAHDFAHFTRSGAAYTCAHDTQRHIARVAAREAVRDEAGAAFVVLAISGASFLYHQVRSMVGAVVAVVRGARSEAWLGRVLLPPRRSRAEPRRVEAAIDKATIAAVPLAPAHALYLAEVHHYSHDLRAAAEGERLRTLRADADGADAGAGGAALVAESGAAAASAAFRRRVQAHIMGVEAREGRMRKWVGELDSEG